MALEMHPNDAAREARPSLWIFSGRAVVLLVAGVFLFILLFLVLSHTGVDFWWTLALSALPLLAITAFVNFFVNGRPPSYAWDLLVLARWRVRSRIYMAGCLERPPQLWVANRKPAHPKEFQ
jgi:hypothetical protein